MPTSRESSTIRAPRRVLIVGMLLSLPFAHAQVSAPPPPPAASVSAGPGRPLPDIVTLMRQVESNERLAEAVEKDYTYQTASKLVEYNGSGAVKKTETRTYEISFTDGVRIARLIAKDGKPLSPGDQKKEDDRLADAVAKAKERRAQADSNGTETDSGGHDEITLSRMLELGAFANPRRITINGRDTIAIDYTGDPKAKVRNRAEGAVREMAGTVFVDEQDKAIEHLEGHFDQPYKVGGGLLINVAQGTTFRIQNVRLNNEVWLPSSFDAHGHARVLLFVSFDGDLSARMSNYHKFRASARILPGLSKVDPNTPNDPASQTPTPPDATPPPKP